MGWAPADLVSALRKQVLALEADLKRRVDGDEPELRQAGVFEAWKADYDKAFAAKRTAWTWLEWRNDRITQVAVGWVLLTVFARYCEDHVLVSPRWIGGADADQRGRALDERRAYFQAHPEHSDRDWLRQIIDHFAKYSATSALVDEHAPLHLVAPSGDAARALLEFWWQLADDGEPVYLFTGVDTRFLGDIYENLSAYARKTYALRQTPVFVEEFILDQTMEPALADRPLEGFTVIDPTCGSGHFLLGAFDRLHRRWQNEAPGLGTRELVKRALDGVYGVDINPFAVAIARFRLLVAAMHAAGDASVEQEIDYEPNLASGDSLIWGANQQLLPQEVLAAPASAADQTEDVSALTRILQRKHDVVVGNPPYINPPDRYKRHNYRLLYPSIKGKYTLTIPFMELFFQLAYPSGKPRPAGWVGKITSNAFMKRDYGQLTIERLLKGVDVRKVIDSEGAWIPGHNSDGTPTVVIIGRNSEPQSSTVLTVLSNGLRETRAVEHSAYWQSIVDNIANVGFSDKWVTIRLLDREVLATHPWAISGDGAIDLIGEIESASHVNLEAKVFRVGFFGIVGVDEAFSVPNRDFSAERFTKDAFAPLTQGKDIRDFVALPKTQTFFPYTSEHKILELSDYAKEARRFWSLRTILGNRTTFAGNTYLEESRPWHGWHQLPTDEGASTLSIAFAEVASHNHFVLSRQNDVFNQTAPVIKLSQNASFDETISLVGVLNTSIACFWLKNTCKPKGGAAEYNWLRTYQYSSNRLKKFPLPNRMPTIHAELLEHNARQLYNRNPAAITSTMVPTHSTLTQAKDEFERIHLQLVARQEELDWDYYRIYGLLDDDLTYTGELPGVALGERPFEIAMAREEEDSDWLSWFEKHRSTPVTEVPDRFPVDYRELLERRLKAIESNPHIRLLERPEYKRRWESEPWDTRVASALRGWLLDRVEDKALWFDRDGRPTPQSVAQLADLLDRNEDFRNVLQLWSGDTSVSAVKGLTKLLADESVPFLSAYRYKPAGLDKRAAWEDTWASQRREDAGEKLADATPVPPKYVADDFARATYAAHRGEFDVPKERFIGYPNAGRDTDTTELLGWAGWDHADQALALASLISHRIDDGWDATQLTPLLAGLNELAPWVRQWHNDIDPEYGESVADTIDAELRTRLNEYQLTETDLTRWQPPQPTRGRKTKNS